MWPLGWKLQKCHLKLMNGVFKIDMTPAWLDEGHPLIIPHGSTLKSLYTFQIQGHQRKCNSHDLSLYVDR